MLIAYLDEIGETGAFISKEHGRFNTSPAFGYAGFVIPDEKAREFGALFTNKKRQLFAREIEDTEVKEPGSESTWEMKGANYFHKYTDRKNPERIRIFNSLIHNLLGYGGHIFYYADEKERGTPKQTRLDTDAREKGAMEESLNRLARYAESQDQNMLVIIDQINEKERKMRAHRMYGHVYSRSQRVDEMKRIIEAPMHLDSGISGSIQFADWIAAIVGRAIDYHLIEESKFDWVPDAISAFQPQNKAFTYESKLHFFERTLGDINHSKLFCAERPVYPVHHDQYIDLDTVEKMKQIAYATRRQKSRKNKSG